MARLPAALAAARPAWARVLAPCASKQRSARGTRSAAREPRPVVVPEPMVRAAWPRARPVSPGVLRERAASLPAELAPRAGPQAWVSPPAHPAPLGPRDV